MKTRRSQSSKFSDAVKGLTRHQLFGEIFYWAACLLALALFAAFVVVLQVQGQPTNLSDNLLHLAAALIFGVIIWFAVPVIIYVVRGRRRIF